MLYGILAAGITGALLALIRVLYVKAKVKSEEHNKSKPKGYWICPNCHQKNFNSKDVCGNCKTNKPNE